MPYPLDHKAKTRERILASAAQLFTKRGYDQVSIDQIMEHANLTRGAFYNHFPDKSTLYAAAIQYASHERFQHYALALDKGESISHIIASYLNHEHVQGKTPPCALAFLVSDISQRDLQVRETYTQVYKNLLKSLEHAGTTEKRERLACLAASVLMVGGVAIGRALEDEEITQELLAACRIMSLQLLESHATD